MKKGIASSFIGILMIAVFSVAMFFVLKGFWAFASFFAWGFLLVAGIVNYKVIIDYGKRLFDLLKRRPLYGIGGIAFSVFLYPIVFFILMMRALGGKMIKSAGFEIPGQVQPEKEEFVDYEIVEEEELELKELEIKKREYRQ